jgi:hypothetical protein
MIDNFALGLTHGLMILAAWRLLTRPDLDDDNASPETVAKVSLWTRLRSRSRA